MELAAEKSEPSSNRQHLTNITFFICTLLIIVSPIFRGGNRPLAQMGIELVSILLLFFIVARPNCFKSLSRWHLGLLFVFTCYPLIYLIPMPFEWWAALPGHKIYDDVYNLILQNQQWLTLSLHTESTFMYWLATLPAVILFLAIVGMPTRLVLRLVPILITVAFLEALLGLAQYGLGDKSELRFGLFNGLNAVGTYANRNHFVGLLEMILPVALAAMIAKISLQEFTTQHHRGVRLRMVSWFQGHGNHILLYSFIIIIIILAIVFSRSRSGLAITMFGLFIAAIVYLKHLGSARGNHFISVIIFLSIILAAEIGLAPVLQRFGLDDALSDLRWDLFDSVGEAVAVFFPIGSGPGTFSKIYPMFQPENINAHVIHAHNDYLEWFMESGLIAISSLVLFVILFLHRLVAIILIKEWRLINYIQIGAGIGIISMLIHSVTDFNLHIPANALIFAVLCAFLFHTEDKNPKWTTGTKMASQVIANRKVERFSAASDTQINTRSLEIKDKKNPFSQ